MTRRIAVTGVGIVCALGRDQREFWSNTIEGRGGIGRLDLFEAPGCRSDRAAQARPDSASERRRASRTDRFCMMAAREATAQAGLSEAELASFGVSLGSSTAGMLEAEAWSRRCFSSGFARARPSQVLHLPSSTPADAVARALGASGPRLSNMTACSSSAASVGLAADLIRDGDARGMIAGGGDALCLMTYAGFNALRLLDAGPCRPFDAGRQGLSLGEGAGALVLEDWAGAVERGARPLAEFLEYGASCDAHHMTAPHPEGRGAAGAMATALARAGLQADQVDHINAHGTGTQLNDISEAKAIREVFGARAARIPVTSSKSQLGHLLGGSGGVEAVALVLSLMHQMIPPTLRCQIPDPDVGLDVVSGSARAASLRIGISNSFGFGGTNYSLLFAAVS